MPLPVVREQQFDYDDWANRELLARLQPLAPPQPPQPPQQSPRALRLLCHVVGASRLWLARLEGKPAPCAVWPEWGWPQLAQEIAGLRERWREWAAPLDGTEAALAGSITYANSKGERHSSGVADVLTHVVLHGVHHRAQLLSDLRAAGHEPPLLDFIHATRTGRLSG